MPKKTFLQLAKDKKERFINVALKEFSTKDYTSSSISAIVKELGIAKGSVYQYFKNKKDLYLYLLEEAQKVKLSYVQGAINAGYKDFWELYEKMFAGGIQFDLNHPRHSCLLLMASQEKQVEELAQLNLKNKQLAWDMMSNLLEQEQAAGRLRTDLPLEVMSWQVIAISTGIAEYLQLKYDFNYIENAYNNKPAFALSEKEILETVQYMIEVLKNGLLNSAI